MRILLVSENVTLAHLSRCLYIADLLADENLEIILAANISESFIRSKPFNLAENIKFYRINSINQKDFLKAISWGLWPYNKKVLSQYLDEDLRLLRQFQPDLVIYDFRLSLQTACQFLKIPHLGLVNAYWKKESQNEELPVPAYKTLNFLPLSWAQKLFTFATPKILKATLAGINSLRENLQLGLYEDFDQYFCFGENGIYPDSHSLIDIKSIDKESHQAFLARFIGPISWQPKNIDDNFLLNPNKKTVYLALGSSGSRNTHNRILRILQNLDVNVISSSKSIINGLEAAKNSDLVICNGGSPTSYQALSAGTPVLGLPENLDQFICMQHLSKFSAVSFLRPERTKNALIKEKISNILNNPRCKESALNIQSEFKHYNIKQRIIELACKECKNGTRIAS